MLATYRATTSFSGGTSEQDVRDHCLTLLCRQNSLINGTRQKSEQMGYAWHIIQDKNMICYILVTSKEMPDEVASSFLKNLSNQLYESSWEFKSNPQSISTLEVEAKTIIDGLQTNLGKAMEAKSTLDSVTQKMRSNLNRIFDNQDDLESMDLKSNSIKMGASDFYAGTNRLEKMARARRIR